MSDDRGRTFLSRWSRRKAAARQEAAVPEVPTPAVAQSPDAAVAEVTAPAELPDVESLDGLRSEYRDFLKPEVDESLRRTAFKKLFADPHFNVMDGLDIYIDDYSKPDPIPHAMLRSLNQARGLFLFDDEAQPEQSTQHGESAHAVTQQTEPPAALLSTAEVPAAGTTVTTNCPDATQSPVPAAVDPDSDRKIG